MKEKMKRIINLIILVAIAIVAFLLVKNIPSMLIGKEGQTSIASIETIQKIDKVEQTAEAMAPGAAFDVKGEVGTLVKGNGYTRVVAPSAAQQIYCAMKGGSLSSAGYTYEQVYDYTMAQNGKSSGWVRKSRSHVRPEIRVSALYYFVSQTRAANPAEGYVLTWPAPGWNDWADIKQEAVWDMSSLSANKKPPKASVAGAIADLIAPQAEAYWGFKLNIDANGGMKIGNGDLTNQANVKVHMNEATQEYTVGPFKLNYVDGDYKGIVFGGISDMYIVGKQTSRIEIKSFIINNSEISPMYFKPIDNVWCVAQGGTVAYPKPGEEFYVKFDARPDEQIDKIHVDFKWMELQASITYYEGYKYKSVYTEKEDSKTVREKTGTKTVSDGEGGTKTEDVYENIPYYKCTISSAKVVRFNAGSQRLLSAVGSRWIVQDSLEIPIPDHKEPEPPPSENLQMKLAGYVWEDEKASKESKVNGKKDGGENFKEGVEVILHYEDGSIVKKDGNRKQLKNPYVTDTDGYYEFNDLDSKKKYYIEFVYDGQIYQATEYSGSRLPSSNNDVNSNAMEVRSEREAYNANFYEIMSAPGNYKVRRKLSFYNGGSTNTAWIISKSSSETPYGIKELYEEVKNKAIELGSYEAAYNSIKNSSNISKLQFIEDCRISSYTNTHDDGIYPIYDQFVEDYSDKTVGGVHYHALYPEHLNIDFGITKRETFDLALRKDVEKATIEINGKVHTYYYDERAGADETDDGTWDIGVRLSDAYYNTRYSREIFPEDYQYKVSNYGNAETYGKTKADELNVYVTYKVTVRNQSESILGEVMELVDYYDEDFEYVDERSYIQIKRGNNAGIYNVDAAGESIYGAVNSTDINGYDPLYVRGLQGKRLTSGQTAYVFLTFRVKKDNYNNEDWVRLDEVVETAQAIGVGKENIAEINGFRTTYANGVEVPNVGDVSGKIAGLFDYDAVPGNVNPADVPKDGNIKYNNFEDDTDKAPNIRLILYRENGELVFRQIDGVVWEDERNETNSTQVTAVGDGVKQDKESTINGVTIQLVELMDNGTEYIWQTFSSGQNAFDNNAVYTPIINTAVDSQGRSMVIINNQNVPSGAKLLIPSANDTTEGKYIFRSYMPGNYVVRFIYGDTVKTVLPNGSTDVTNAIGVAGQNAKSYNGQDYKSTTYQEGIDQNASIEGRNSNYWSNENGRLTYTWREDETWSRQPDPIIGAEKTRIQTFKADYSNNETANATVAAGSQQGYVYDITASDANQNVSDAKDIMTDNNVNTPYGRQSAVLNSRNDVIDYSDNDVQNYIAEVLASHEKLPLNNNELNTKLQELMQKTQMTAETGMIVVELEYDSRTTDTKTKEGQEKQGNYKINNVSLGLEERPKAQLSTNKQVTNVRLVLADGSTLFDASSKATNVLWRDHKPYTYKVTNNKLQGDPMATIREQNSYDAQYGLIQMSMDEELMHGATIKISYKITITNVGEVDYKDNEFYYTGNIAPERMNSTVVRTEPNQLVDYVANNLQFYKVDNDAWQVIEKDQLISTDTTTIDEGKNITNRDAIEKNIVNNTLKEQVAKYNTVITTSENSNIAKAKLVPLMYNSDEASVSDDLVLTQLITSENETDDLTYRNIVEIVRTSNDVGRRNAYSIAGNQNPLENATEVDTNVAQIVKILPPFGNGGEPYVIAAIIGVSSLILIAGIVFIKKKILK